MTPHALIEILERLSDSDRAFYRHQSDLAHWGWVQTPDRIAAVASCAAHEYPGDLTEIGCYAGNATQRLCAIAQEVGRRVIAVDPWDKTRQACEGWEYEEFLRVTAPYKELLDVVRLPSQDEKAIAYLKGRALCFAFVDGFHVPSALISDLLAVMHSKVIAVDDILWDGALLSVFEEASYQGKRTIVRYPYNNEGYLL